MKPLVIVRPQPAAEATAQAARAIGLEPLVMPLFAIEPLDWAMPDLRDFDGLLLTSANAPRQAGAQLHKLSHLPAYCVGPATAQAASDAGLLIGATGRANIDSLLQSLSEPLRLLHLAGEERRTPPETAHSIAAIAVYRSAELPRPAGFSHVEGAVVAVHSPRAAALAARHADGAGLDRSKIAIAAISQEAARAAGSGWAAVEAAPEPWDSQLLAISLRLCNKPA